MKQTRIIYQLTLFAIVFGLTFTFDISPVSANQSAKKNYTLGAFPHLPPREMEAIYAPMTANLAKHLGVNIVFKTSSSFESFREKTSRAAFDIVFVQPFYYIQLAEQYGYLPLATRSEVLETIVVANKDSPINGIEDLRGKTVALPPKIAAVSLMLRAHLRKHNFVIGKDVFISHYKSHLSCLQQVLIRKADVCGTVIAGLRNFRNKMKANMKIISRTDSIPHTLFAVNPQMSEDHRNLILKTILSWNNSDEGRKLLKKGHFTPFVQAFDEDYDSVRELDRVLKQQ